MKQSSLLSNRTGKMRQPQHNQYERLSCMKTKGIYPYSWAESAGCYNLPYLVEKEHFFNTLTQSHISDDEYNFAKKVWSTFEMKTMNDYCRMYCLTGNLEKLLHGSMRHRFLEFRSSKKIYIFRCANSCGNLRGI